MKQEQSSLFIKGALILGAAEIIVKILGALYRIPLTRMIGDEGMGYYSSGYMVYTWLFTLSTTGIPVAISRMVSEKVALKQYKEAHKIFSTAIGMLFVVGLFMSGIFYMGAQKFSVWIHNPSVYVVMIALSPTLFFVCLSSGFRGYFQGYENMIPTAISKVVEQGGKVVLGLLFTVLLLQRGTLLGAAGATLGTTVGALFGLMSLGGCYVYWKRIHLLKIKQAAYKIKESTSSILYRLVFISIPISIGASVYAAANLVDLVITQKRLKIAGFSSTEVNILFGQYAGKMSTLINFPTVLTLSLAAALVPSIAAALTKGRSSQVNYKIQQALRMTLLIVLPAAVGMSLLAEPILLLLFGKECKGASILQIGAFTMIYLALVQVMTSILQGVGKVIIPAAALLFGAVIKIFINYYLIAIPFIHIRGAVIGTIMCYFTAAMIDYIYIRKYTGFHLRIKEFVMKPTIAALLMGVGAKITYSIIFEYFAKPYSKINWHKLIDQLPQISQGEQIFLLIQKANSIAITASIVVSIMLYGVLLLLSNQLYYEDFCITKTTQKIGDFLIRFGWIKSFRHFPK